MNRLARHALVCACAVSAFAASSIAQSLPTDPSLVTGELDNGLEYIVRQHAVPPGRAVVDNVDMVIAPVIDNPGRERPYKRGLYRICR